MNEKIRVDFNVIDTYTMKDPDFEKEFVAMAIESINTALENISREIALKDFEKIKAFSHKLKGASSIAGLMEINRIARQMNEMQELNIELLSLLLAELEEETQLANQILEDFLKQ